MRIQPAVGILAVLAIIGGCALASPALASGAWLGVSVQDVTQELKEAMNLKATSGALVSDVVSDSPADKAGLKQRDVILKIDDKTVEKAADLVEYVSGKDPANTVRISFVRGDDEKTIDVALGPRPSAAARPDRGFPRRFAMPDMPRTMTFFAQGPELGVQVHPLDEHLAPYFHGEAGKGVLVLGVSPDSPAAKAGIQEGDVLLSFNGQPISDPEGLRQGVRKMHAGDDWKAEALRDGHTMDFQGRVERGWRSPAQIGVFRPPMRPGAMMENAPGVMRRRMARLQREVEELRARVREMERRLEERMHQN